MLLLLSRFSHVRLFVTPWTVAHKAPLSIGFSRQEYWCELLYPPPGHLPDSGIKLSLLRSCIAGGFFNAEPPGSPQTSLRDVDPLRIIKPSTSSQKWSASYFWLSQPSANGVSFRLQWGKLPRWFVNQHLPFPSSFLHMKERSGV